MTACPACAFDPEATVSARWEFRIGRDLHTTNRHVVNGRHGWAYRRARAGWHSDMYASRLIHAVAVATGKRRVTITRLYSGRQREMDLGNIDVKACVDAMKLAGLIVDDRPAVYEGHVKQERGADRGTRIVIEEIAQ